MSHSISDVASTLFAQMQRLSDKTLTAEELEAECKRGQVMMGLGDTIISGANAQLKAAQLFATHGQAVLPHLPQIGKTALQDGRE